MSFIRNTILLKIFFEFQSIPLLIPFLNGNNKTIFKNLEQQFECSNQNYNIYFANILDGEMKRHIKMAASIEH